jgi:glycosyltransferase involved in cell wall biosynthesis
MAWPSAGVVVPTFKRPDQLRRAVEAICAQDYPGPLGVLVVFDQAAPDRALVRGGYRPVAVRSNERTPGLAGSRNTGILSLDTDLVAFCDDDDTWLPGKLRGQVAALRARNATDMATCAVEVDYDGARTPRLAGLDTVELPQLVESRMAMLHASTFLLRRTSLIGGLGLVAEDAPGSQNEDWDLLLRAARRGPIAHYDEPLVRVHWGRSSHFARNYSTKISSLHWMLARHPEIKESPRGAARVYGQLACWSAATGEHRQAWKYTRTAIRNNWREPRAAIALAAATRVVNVESILSLLHRRGRGI